MSDPTVTVITPAFNAANTLEKTVQSLRDQTFAGWTAILVNDGSTDGTGALIDAWAARDHRVVGVHQEQGGESSARNAGLARASGDWVLFLDADDWLLPSCLERLTRFLADEPDLDVVHCGWVRVTEDGRRGPPTFAPTDQELFPVLTRYNCFAVHACLVRRKLVEGVGGFDETLSTCSDWDLWQRIARTGPRYRRVREVLACYRLRPGSAGTLGARLWRDGRRVIARGHSADPRVPEPAAPYADGMASSDEEGARLEFACWVAGLAIGRGEDPFRDLAGIAEGPRVELRPDRAAGVLFEAIPVPTGQLPDFWGRAWPEIEPHLDAFLQVLESRSTVPGLALECKSRLVRKILRFVLEHPPGSGKREEWIAELEGAKMWLEEQSARWERTARERDRTILELEAWACELSEANAWLEAERDRWQALAEGRDPGELPPRSFHRAGPPPEAPGSPVAAGTVPPNPPRETPERPEVPVLAAEPLSREWGFDRGTPIDRVYIEEFLARNRSDVTGRVLEVGDDTYTRRFGGDRVESRDVLHVSPGNPSATLVADLTRADHIPDDTFDCVILTQTLQLIYDLPAAVAALARILKPGGVLLATVPGTTRTSRREWADGWFWSLTPASTRRLFEAHFPPEALEIQGHGNVMTASAFLYGLAAEELPGGNLGDDDPEYDVVVTIRAAKAPEEPSSAGPASGESASGDRLRKRATRTAPGHGSRASPGLILLYHRVSEGHPDPWALCVRPGRFSEHLDILRDQACVVPLHELVGVKARATTKSKPLVAITFDDGYSDNLHEALPLLEHRKMPATLFAVTDVVACGGEFWWDTLERLLLRPGALPRALRIELEGSLVEWDLGGGTEYPSTSAHLHARWRAWEPPPTSRHALFLSLWEALRVLPAVKRSQAIEHLVEWAGRADPHPPQRRALRPDELKALAQSPLVDIGAHTASHPSLAALTTAEQEAEIVSSRTWLEGTLGARPECFSYPFGQTEDYDTETARMVSRAGFRLACTSVAGAVGVGSDPCQLPRMAVQDWDGEEFLRRLGSWLAPIRAEAGA
jgi:peptidoglycan/xylan/chitin deacetylase (PgdA/CDA1 family)/SAM-dependent methyltransferase